MAVGSRESGEPSSSGDEDEDQSVPEEGRLRNQEATPRPRRSTEKASFTQERCNVERDDSDEDLGGQRNSDPKEFPFPIWSLYSSLWKAIIRPPRSDYTVDQMGPVRFRLPPFSPAQAASLGAPPRSAGENGVYERRDFRIWNNHGQAISCSHFLPSDTFEPLPCVVYLHGSSSSRMDVFPVLPALLRCHVSVFAFDFAGSGQSQGEFVSLGYYEEQDIECVLRYLRRLDIVSTVGLWGRSMGAVAALIRATQDPELGACVFESPFADFSSLVKGTIANYVSPIPDFITDMALSIVSREVLQRHGFDPRWLQPIKQAPWGICSALFGAASEDTLVPFSHVKGLSEAWGGECSLRVFEGSHCETRPECWLWEAVDFITSELHMAEELQVVADRVVHTAFERGHTESLRGPCLSRTITRSSSEADELTPRCSPQQPDPKGDVLLPEKLMCAVEEHLQQIGHGKVIEQSVTAAIEEYLHRCASEDWQRTASDSTTASVLRTVI